MGKAVLVGAGGAAVAVGVAVLASPLMPLGLARIAEPDPGVSADWLVLGIGALATLVAVSASASCRPAGRPPGGGDRAQWWRRPVRRSQAPLPVHVPTSMTSGIRLATRASGPQNLQSAQPSSGRACRSWPDRSPGVRELETPGTGAATVRLRLGRGRHRRAREPRRPSGLSAARPRGGHLEGQGVRVGAGRGPLARCAGERGSSALDHQGPLAIGAG